MSRLGRSPGRAQPTTRGTTFSSKQVGDRPPFDVRAGVGATAPSQITMRAAADLDQQYKAHGCTGCDDMGSDLRVKTLAFKAACLLDPATMNNVSLNVSTPLAQSGFGPGTDAALTMILGATRQSQGHCTDDNGFCTVGGAQTPAVPPELAALQDGLNKVVNGVIGSGQQVPQTDATLQVLVQQIVAAFKQFTDQLKQYLATHEQPHPPPAVPQGNLPAVPPPTAMMPAPKSNVGLALGVVGIALVALGTGAVIVTYSKRKAKR